LKREHLEIVAIDTTVCLAFLFYLKKDKLTFLLQWFDVVFSILLGHVRNCIRCL